MISNIGILFFLLKLSIPAKAFCLWYTQPLSPVHVNPKISSPCSSFGLFFRAYYSYNRCPLFRQWLCGKAASGLKEFCAEHRLKELQESMDRCTGCCDINEILLKMALSTIQSINPHIIIVYFFSLFGSLTKCHNSAFNTDFFSGYSLDIPIHSFLSLFLSR